VSLLFVFASDTNYLLPKKEFFNQHVVLIVTDTYACNQSAASRCFRILWCSKESMGEYVRKWTDL